MRNRGAPTNNTSGFKGVSAVSNGKWSAKIKLKYKLYYIGSFDTPEAAHAAYVAASEVLHGEFARAA